MTRWKKSPSCYPVLNACNNFILSRHANKKKIIRNPIFSRWGINLWNVSTLVTLIYTISSWIHPLNLFFFFINKCTHRLQIHISKFIHGNNKYSVYTLHSCHSVRRINIIALIQRNDCYWICNWFRTSTSIITFYKFRRKLVSIGKIPILSTKPVELWNTLQSLW